MAIIKPNLEPTKKLTQLSVILDIAAAVTANPLIICSLVIHTYGKVSAGVDTFFEMSFATVTNSGANNIISKIPDTVAKHNKI